MVGWPVHCEILRHSVKTEYAFCSRGTSYNGHTGGGGRGGAVPEGGTFFRAKGVWKDRDFITCMKG